MSPLRFRGALLPCLLGLVAWEATLPDVVGGLPMKVLIRRGEPECVYDTLEAGEQVTITAFVLSGPTLRATMTMDGPMGTGESTLDLWTAAQAFRPRHEEGAISHSQILDWEDLILPPVEDQEEEEEEEEEDLDPEDPEYKHKLAEQRERQRQRAIAKRGRMEGHRQAQQEKMREEGDPIQFTTRAPVAGWYRMCLEPVGHEIVAEMDMRKESELGAVDEDGHVITYEEMEMNKENAELDKDTASEEGIKDEDFDDTKEKLKDMRRLLNQVQTMQQNERRRISVQAENNEHAHSRMVLSSVIETLVFMGITGFQIHTIRKWFSGAPALGR